MFHHDMKSDRQGGDVRQPSCRKEEVFTSAHCKLIASVPGSSSCCCVRAALSCLDDDVKPGLNLLLLPLSSPLGLHADCFFAWDMYRADFNPGNADSSHKWGLSLANPTHRELQSKPKQTWDIIQGAP